MNDFSYQEQLLLWKKRQLLLQKKYADTPPGFPSAEAEKAAWAAWKEEYARFLENGRFRLQAPPLPSVSFPLIGREEELTLVRDTLASFHTAFLYGIGGIGKTAIALTYITKYGPEYDHVLHVVTGRGILQVICDDIAVPISGLQYDRKRYPLLRQYYREKLNALQTIGKTEKLLIVIDNMNMPANKDLRQFLKLPCDKIITTRINYEIVPEAEKIPVNALCPEYWPELIRTYYSGSEQTKAEQLLHYGYQVCGHTLSLKMASVQASCKKTVGQPDGSRDITDLLSSFRLKKAELQALLYLSVLAPQGMEKDMFLLVSGASERTLTTLRNYLLIDAFGSVLRVHPLIAEAVKRIMPPTCINCSRLLRGFEKHLYGDHLRIGTWNRTYEENRGLEPHIFALYETFPQPAPWLATAFEEIATFLWIQGYYEEALPYAIRVYEAAMDYYGPNHVLPGREALRVAAVYHNHLDHDQALIWYQKGYELLSAATPRTFEVMDQLTTACVKLTREYSHRRDTETQEKYACEYRRNLHDLICLYGDDITEYQKERISIKHYYFLIEEAKHALREGRVGDSQKLNESIEKWAEIYGKDLAYRKAPVTELKIALLIRTDQLDSAEKIARENVQSTLLYRGEKYKDYLSHLEILADVLFLEKKTAEAYSIYEEILVRLQRDYPYEKKWIQKIIDTLTSAI